MNPHTGTPVVGVIGAGQLARMTQQAAIALGQSLRILATDPGEPAALVARDVVLGSHTDPAALRELAHGCDVVTFDHEHVPQERLRELLEAGVNLQPAPDALRFAQDKLAMRQALSGLDVPVPPFRAVETPADVVRFGAEHGWPCVLKAIRGGYDGRGVWMLNTPTGAQRVVAELIATGTPLMVEQCVAMHRELAVLVARSPLGQGATWPVVQTVQRDGICVEVLVPAPGLDPDRAARAEELGLRIAAELGVTGVLAVELFDTDAGLVVNELAMRPHNSGHWTIEGAVTSQFEQHLRAVLDYPLGATQARAPAVVMANVLGADLAPTMGIDERLHHLFARYPQARAHLYGKAERPGRKIGHVTVLGGDLDEVRTVAVNAAEFLSAARWPDGFDPHHVLEPERGQNGRSRHDLVPERGPADSEVAR